MRRGGLLACLLLLIMLSHPSYCAATSELGSECDDMPAAEAIAFGRLRHRANDFAGAVRCLERPAGGDVKAAIYLSESLLRAGDVARAVATLERVIASDPGSRISFAHLLLGSARQRAGDSKGAVVAYETALRIEPDNLAGLVNCGTALRENGRLDEAHTKFQRAHKAHPASHEAAYNLADTHYARGEHSAAIKAARSALQARPSFCQAHALTILSHEALRDVPAAVKAADKAVKEGGACFSSHYHRARMLRAAARFAEAEQEFNVCLSFKSLSQPISLTNSDTGGVAAHRIAYAHNEVGHMLSRDLARSKDAAAHWQMQHQQETLAIERKRAVDAAVEVDPSFAQGWGNAGTESRVAAVEVDPSFAQGWVNAASNPGRSTESRIAAYRKALVLAPNLAEAWINLGQTFYNNFRDDATFMPQALEAFSQAVAVDPTSSSAIYSLARTSVDLCRWNEWEVVFERLCRALRADIASGTLAGTSASMVYLMVFPIPDSLLLDAFRARAESAAWTAAGLIASWREGGGMGGGVVR
ncbi:hypothetical protein T484DRAFT_1887051, partial [Baffinella frigidus]